MSSFTEKFSCDERSKESQKIMEKYPGRIPIIVERKEKADIQDIDKHKFLVPNDISVGQFIYIIRKRIKLSPEKALFIFVNNILPPTAQSMLKIYEQHKGEDGFLYITYSGENTFGKDF